MIVTVTSKDHTVHTYECDDFVVDANGVLMLINVGVNVAAFADGYWLQAAPAREAAGDEDDR